MNKSIRENSLAVLRRYNRYQGLKDLDVFIDDSAPISQYFNVVEVPDIITQGRSSFLVGGSPLLKDNVELKFEIVNDASGKVVYTEAIPNYLEGTSRRVSIEVYDDPDLFGDATMYFVGELSPDKVDVPVEWLDIYNVRWYSKIYISGAGVNTEPIYFYKQPSMWVGEIVKGFVTTTYPTGSVTQSIGTVSGDPLPGTVGTSPIKEEAPGAFVEQLQNSYTSKIYGGGGKNAGFNSRGRRVRRSSPEVEKFTINLDSGEVGFDARHIGATFKVNNPQPKSTFVTESYHEFPGTFETTIKDVKNESTLIPTKEFVITDTRYPEGNTQRDVIVPLDNTAYTMSFQPAPTHSTSTVNFRSFADVRISKMRTFSGDVHRVKLYSRNKDAFGDFEQIADTPIESPELLYDIYSPAGSRRIGYFDTQDVINTYWESGSNTTLTRDSSILLDSVYISGSSLAENSILKAQTTGSLPITFVKDIEYAVRARIVGRKSLKTIDSDGNTVNKAELGIFLSGSAFESNHGYGSDFGYQMTPPGESKGGFLTIPDSVSERLDFGIVEEVFQPLRNGTAVLQFGAPSGYWNISDVSITPVADTGFSPDWIRVVAPVPPLSQERPDDYEFIAEFYDVNNNIADTISHVSASTFQGGNSYILGDDNVLSGSMFIGNAIGGGIELAGVGSGFVRSIGYSGFTSGSAGTGGPGFMMWSGSVLSDITDEYDGVGLELFGSSTSYLRYRTNPSDLDIRADAFFVGNENSQFISGSGNNIEISSSNFHVQPDGDVVMQGTITADAGNIGDWQIVDGKLSGSNATLDAVGAALYHTTKGPGSDTSAAFDLRRDEYYIDFTPSEGDTATSGKYYVKFGPNFSVSQSGVLFASGAVFEGQITASTGRIGGADIESASLAYSPYWRISASADTSDPASFISSSRFKVSAGGLVTGSAILLGDKGGGNYLQFIDDTLTVEGDITVNSIKTPATIGGVASTTLNASSSISATGLARFVSASIGGWTINSTQISQSGMYMDSSAKELVIGSATFGSKGIQLDYNSGTPRAYIGDGSSEFLKFDGSSLSIQTQDAHISGSSITLKAPDFYLGDSSNYVSGSGGNLAIYSTGATTLSGSSIRLEAPRFFLGGQSQYVSGSNGNIEISSSNFHLTNAGDVTMAGTVTATAGYIGGWTINSTNLASSGDAGIRLNANGDNAEISINTHTFAGEGIQLGYNSGNPRFYVGDGAQDFLRYDTNNGVEIKTAIFKLDTANLDIDSSTNSGYISLGSTPNTSITGTNKGIYMDGTGDFLLYGSATNYFKFDASAESIDIKSDTFDLATTQLVIDSATNSGKIAMGGTPPTAYNSGNGFYVDGDSNLLIGSASGDHIQYNATSNVFDVKVGSLELDATNIEISSTNASMSLGEGKILLDGANSKVTVGSTSTKQITLQGHADYGYIATGKTSATSTTAGFWLANNDTDPEFHVGNTTDYIKFDGGEIDLASRKLEVSASTIQVSTAESSMSFGHTAADPRGKIIIEGKDTPTFRMGPDADFISLATGSGIYMDGDGNFRFGDADGGIVFENGSFAITGSDVDLNITDLNISATGFKLSSPEASMSLGTDQEIYMKGGNNSPYIAIQPGVAVPDKNYGESGLFFGVVTGTTPKVSFVGTNGHLKMDGSTLDIDTTTFELDANDGDLQISSTQKSMSLNDQTIVMDGANAKIMVGLDATKRVTIQGGANDNFMVMGSKSSFTHFDQSTQGIIIGMDSTVPKFEFAGSATNYISYDGSNFDIKLSQGLELAATNIQLSSTHASMSLGGVPGALANITLDGANSKIQVGATGSNSITLQGGTADNYMVMGSKSSFTHEGSGTAGIIIGMDATNPQAEFVKDSGNYFIFDGSSGVDIKTTNFELDANTGDLQLSSNHKSMSLGDGKIKLQGAATPYVQVGTTNPITLKTDGTDSYMTMGSKTSFTHYDKSTVGIIIGMDTGVPKFELAKDSKDYLRWDSTDGLDIKTRNMEVSASNIQISSLHASMSIGDPASSGGAIVLHADGTDKMLKFGGKTTFDQTTTAGLIMGMDGTSPEFDYTVGTSNDQYVRMLTSGIFMKVPNFELDTTNLDISSTNRRIQIFNASNKEVVRIGEISEAAGDEFGIKMYDGTTSGSEHDDDGFSDVLAMFGGQGNKIAGWELTGTQIRSIPAAGMGEQFAEGEVGLILQASGSIETSDFVTGLKGWRISSLGNGTAEFENARIRGTLATTVFEKESVNVVGGQLMVANSTTLESLKDVSGSIICGVPSMSAASTTMSVANVSGFRAGEILKSKKVNSTGFTVEYLYISGSQRYTAAGSPYSASIAAANMGAVDPDGLAGEIYVERGLGQTVSTGSVIGTLDGAIDDSVTAITLSTGTGYAAQSILKIDDERMKVVSHSTGGGLVVVRDFHDTTAAAHSDGVNVHVIDPNNEFLAGLVSTPETYEEGQVFVSTGVYAPADDVSSGYILMNANPNDISTPYMDIVERTGSGVYDLQLRTRIGDLSGLSSAYLYGDEEPGFGIYTENGFFKGAIHAMTGSIHGILHVATLAGGIETGAKISIGRNVSGTQDGIYINNNNYWFTDAEWRVGDGTNYLHLTGSGGNLGNDLRVNLEKLELNAGGGNLKISSTNKSMSFGDGDIIFQSYDATNSWGRIGATSTKAIYITGSDQVGAIRSGKTSVSDTTEGFWIANNNADAEFVVGDGTDYLKFDDNNLTIKTREFELDADTGDLQISSTQHSMSFADGTLKLGRASNGISYLRVGSTLGKDVQITGSATLGVIRSGKTSAADTTEGFWLANNNADAEFVIGDSTDFIKFDDNELEVKTRKLELDAGDGDVQISSTHASMSLGGKKIVLKGDSNPFITINSGSANDIKLKTDGTDAYMVMGSKDDFGDEGKDTAGILIGMDSNNPQAEFVKDSSNYFIFDDGVDIKTDTFQLDASGDLQLSSTQKSMSIANGAIELAYSASTQAYMKLGSTGGQGIEMTGSNYGGTIRSAKENISDTTAGFWLHNQAGTTEFHVGDSTEYIKFDGTDLSIASAHLDITASNIDMTTDEFHLDATDIEISSTEKSMSLGYNTSAAHGLTMVGGSTSQIGFGTKDSYRMKLVDNGSDSYLQVGAPTFASPAQAGILIGSDNGTAEFHIYNAANKKISFDGSDFDIRTTKLYLETTGLTLSGDSGTDTSNYLTLGSATSVDDGEGFYVDGGGNFRIGTATTVASPSYMKFASSALSVRTSNLVIDTSKIDITTEHGGMIALGASSASLSDLSSTGIFLSGSGAFNIQKNASNYIRFDGTNAMEIASRTFTLKGGGSAGAPKLYIAGTTSAGVIALDTSDADAATRGSGTGIYMNHSGEFRAGVGGGNRIDFDGSSTLTIQSDTFDLLTSTQHISSSNGGVIAMGKAIPKDFNDTGIFLSGSGEFNLQKDSNNYLRYTTGGGMDIASQNFTLTGTSGTISLGSLTDVNDIADADTGFYVDSSGNVLIKAGAANTGYLRATDDNIILKTSEFYIGDHANYISGSGGAIDIAADTFDLQTTTMILDSGTNNGTIRLGSSAGPSSVSASTQGIYMDGNGDFQVYGDADNYLRFDVSDKLELKSENFELDTPGLDIVGTDASTPTNNKITLGATANSNVLGSSQGIYMDGAGNFLLYGSAENYFRFNAGGSSIDIKSDLYDLNTTNLRVSSSAGGTIAMGEIVPKSISGSGIFLSGSGDFLAGNHTGNKIQYNQAASAVIMKSNLFSLDATTIVIDSSANDGKIALGATPPSAYNSGNGLYLDGTGKFLAGKATGERIQYDGSNTLIMSSSTFILGDEGSAYISGSNSNIAISSSNFYLANDGSLNAGAGAFTLDTNGNVFMSGSISSSIGNIGGWRIESDKLAGNGGIITLDAENGRILAGTGTDIIKIDASDSDYRIWVGHGTAGSAPFRVEKDGGLIATDADVAGVIRAATGYIGGSGGWTIATAKLHSGTNITLDSGTDEVQIDGSGALGMYFGPHGELNSSAENATGSFWITRDDFSRQIFRVGDQYQFLKFDTGGTPKLFVSSSDFLLGAPSTAFISASNGNIEVSSSNFHVSSSGNVYGRDVYLTNGNFEGTVNANATIQGATVKTGGGNQNISAHNVVITGPDVLGQGAGSYLFTPASGTPYHDADLSWGDFLLLGDSVLGNDGETGRIAFYSGTGMVFKTTAGTNSITTGTETGLTIEVNPFSVALESDGSSYGTDSHRIVGKYGALNAWYMRSNNTGKSLWHIGSSLNDGVYPGQILASNLYDASGVGLITPIIGRQTIEIDHAADATAIEADTYVDLYSGGSNANLTGTYRGFNSKLRAVTDQASLRLTKWIGYDTDVTGTMTYQMQFNPEELIGVRGNIQLDADQLGDTSQGGSVTEHYSGSLVGVQGKVHITDEFQANQSSQDEHHITITAFSGSISTEGLENSQADNSLITYGLKLTTHSDGDAVQYGAYTEGEDYNYFSGKIGIGDTTPDYPLDVMGQASNISIYAQYDVAAYSDIRVKADIETITEPLSKVLKMRGVTFRRTDEGASDKRLMGVIAQEIEDIVPEVVSTNEIEDSDRFGHKSVSYGNMTALLIEAIKEQQEQIDELKQEVKEIKDARSR